MAKNRCHNRPEYPDTTVVQDGWKWVTIWDHTAERFLRTRAPNIVEIPFTMSKGCRQWDAPAGAIHKGLLPAKGCDGCRWKP